VGHTSSFCGANSRAADGSTVPLQQFVVREVGPVEMQRHPDVDDVDEATALVTDAAKVLAIAHLRGDPTFGDKLSNFLPPVRPPLRPPPPPHTLSLPLGFEDLSQLRGFETRRRSVGGVRKMTPVRPERSGYWHQRGE
jgi:hypothetical protein